MNRCSWCGKTTINKRGLCGPACFIHHNVTINPATDCWEWTNRKPDTRYIQTHWQGRSIGAHRLSYETFIGPVKNGEHIRHHCDNPPCCNPVHLASGTRQDNMTDMANKGRARNRTTGKLAPDTLKAIFEANGSTADIAGRFGVSTNLVGRIKLGCHGNKVTGQPCPSWKKRPM